MAIYSVDFTSDVTYGVAPVVVQFNCFWDSDLPLSFLWEFEDGLTSTDENPSHSFIRGTYKITLNVTDGFDNLSVTKYNYIDSYTAEIISIDTVEKLQAIGSPGNAIQEV